jgi:hypothetical protein
LLEIKQKKIDLIGLEPFTCVCQAATYTTEPILFLKLFI